MLRAILNKSWRQHPQSTNYTATCLSSRKLYKLDEPDTQDTAGEARTNSSVMYSYGHPHMANQKQDDQLKHTYSSNVRIRDVALKTCQKRWMIGRSGEKGSGISMLTSRHDDDDKYNLCLQTVKSQNSSISNNSVLHKQQIYFKIFSLALVRSLFLFYPQIWPYQGLLLRALVNLGAVEMNGHHYWTLPIRLNQVKPGHSFVGILPLSRDAVGVFYSNTRLVKVEENKVARS